MGLSTKITKKRNIAKLFAPRSIAIYGVSKDTSKIGSTIFTNLISSGFEGKLFPINPKYSDVFGYKCFKDAKSIPYRVDLAVMAVPAGLVEMVLKDCHEKKIRNLVIISAGFGETGEEGKELEEKVGKLAAKYDINIVGPNCLGLIVPASKMNASFAATSALPGNIAFMSQSGAVCTAILDMANDQGLGFSHFVSIGNKVDLDENDFLQYWLSSEKVDVVGAYLEEFVDGYDFVKIRQSNPDKPVLVLNPGESEEARQAITSHTGSLASSKQVVVSALEKNGVLVMEDLDEMFNAMMAFSWLPMPKGNKVAIVTNAGGPGIITTDFVVKYGMDLAEVSKETQKLMAGKLPGAASTHNPVDVLGDAMSDRYEVALNALLEEKDVDAIILVLTPQLVTQIEETAKLIANMGRSTGKPIVPIFLGGKYVKAGLKRLYDNQIAGFTDISTGVKALSQIYRFKKYLDAKGTKRQTIESLRRTKKINLAKYTKDELTALPEDVVQDLLEQFELPVPTSYVVKNLEGALKAAEEISYPLVLKATTEDIVHKTDFKAIYVGVEDEKQLTKYLTKLQGNIYEHTKREHPPVLMQQMVKAKAELFVGFKRDGGANVYEKLGRGFGHVILFGQGGIYTNVYEDVSRDVLPVNEDEINALLDRTRVSQVIDGARGLKPLYRKGVVDILQKLQKLILTYPEIAEIDINPIMLTRKDAYVVDAKLFVKK